MLLAAAGVLVLLQVVVGLAGEGGASVPIARSAAEIPIPGFPEILIRINLFFFAHSKVRRDLFPTLLDAQAI